jgi:hypothetical protein
MRMVRLDRVSARAALLAAVCLALLAAPSLRAEAQGARPAAKARAAAAPAGQPFATPDAVLRWISAYRTEPKPALLPAAVKAMSRAGLFREADQTGLYVGFMAGVLAANPGEADALVAGMFPMPPEEQVVIVRAIAYSGLADWQALLGRFAERMPARKVLIQRHLDGRLPTLAGLKLDDGPGPIDTLWGFYFATGNPEPVLRIISILHWAEEKNDVERLTIGSMVKWTLANNALRDKALLDIMTAATRHEPPATVKLLREVIEAAETYETAKLRKEAMAAIERLKIGGPEKVRNYNWWGQAGQTALAFGCVVAGALGHFEVGLPCIIGGAVSNAALKALQPQQ